MVVIIAYRTLSPRYLLYVRISQWPRWLAEGSKLSLNPDANSSRQCRRCELWPSRPRMQWAHHFLPGEFSFSVLLLKYLPSSEVHIHFCFASELVHGRTLLGYWGHGILCTSGKSFGSGQVAGFWGLAGTCSAQSWGRSGMYLSLPSRKCHHKSSPNQGYSF